VADYSKFLLREYHHWDLFLHKNQYPYLGRAYAWARREEAVEVKDMTTSEREELFDIVLPHWEMAMERNYGKFKTNFAFFGNDTPHLHAHFIPRFNEVKRFYELEFIDPNPTGNYAPYPKREVSLEVLMRIKEDLKRSL
jgi:diadenosine tetraphosphate (Ap4A) HIT family hydrolase